MFNFEPEKDRWRLGFKEAVLKDFCFLRGCGFVPVAEEVTFIRFESDNVFVNLYHGRGSYEIGIDLGRKDRPEKYGLGYVVWKVGGEEVYKAEGFGGATLFQVSTPDGVNRIVPKVAALLEKYGRPFLLGTTTYYEELARQNELASIANEREQMVRQIRKEAEAAWGAKDYGRIGELYRPIEDELTEIEKKRLAHATKHVPVTERQNP